MKRLLITLLLCLLPATALAQSASSIPKEEEPSRSCYMAAMSYWNNVMAVSPLRVSPLTTAYQHFAGCAKVAVDTGHVLPSGDRLPWTPDYFADTMGAFYAQLQLTVADRTGKCAHLRLASALATQALETESGVGGPATQEFDADFTQTQQKIEAQGLRCNATLKT